MKQKIAEIVLSKEDTKIFVDELLNPREPNDTLKQAVEKYKESWIRSMADAEAKCESVSVGGLAHDTGMLEDTGMPSLECKAAIFALNALCDVENEIYLAFNEALMEHGWCVSLDKKADFVGMPILLRLSLLSEHENLPLTLHEWIARRTEVFIRRRMGQLESDERKLGLFQSLKKRDIKVAVYATVSRDALQTALTKLGIMGLVDVWLGSEDVEVMPPDPAIFEKALEQLKFAPTECVVIDSLYSGWVAAREKNFAMVVEVDSAKDVTEVLF